MTSDEAVTAYVGSVEAGFRTDRVVAVARFPRGENHAVYRVSYCDQYEVEGDVIVRISNSASEAAAAQAAREAAVLSHLQGRVSPRLLDFRTDGAFAGRAVMCLEYIAGRFESLDMASPERMAELGSIVRRTHGVAVEGLARVLDGPTDLSGYVDDRLRSMMARMPLVRDPLPQSTQLEFHEAAAWAEQTALELHKADDPGAPCLLHGDVSAGNLLWTPQPVLIDWEYARIGDPADEIGYLFGQNALRPEQREHFWRGYGDGLEPASLARIVERAARWEPLTLFGSALYWIDLWSRRVRAEATRSLDPSAPKEQQYYLDFAARYLSRCEQVRRVG
jgi:aminoglycoside phosphotransferase (APT) family kinase protein